MAFLVGGSRRRRSLCRNQPVCRVRGQFFTKSFLGDDAAVLARSSGEEPASCRQAMPVVSRRCVCDVRALLEDGAGKSAVILCTFHNAAAIGRVDGLWMTRRFDANAP